jgi:hypothetical protein
VRFPRTRRTSVRTPSNSPVPPGVLDDMQADVLQQASIQNCCAIYAPLLT